MRFNNVTLCLVGVVLVFNACETSTQPAVQQTVQVPSDDAATLEDLPNCTGSREGDIERVASEKTFYICSDGKWGPLQITKETGDNPKREDGYGAAASNGTQDDDNTPTSSVTVVPSSSGMDIPALPSGDESSSSASVMPSSASEVVITPYPSVRVTTVSAIDCSNAMYCPQDCMHTSETPRCGKVYTGLDDGTGTQGYLWSYTDSDNGGTSSFYWPSGMAFGSFEVPSRDNLGYLKGTAQFGSGFEYPFVRLGFHIAGEKKSADITTWGGMCLVYSAAQDFYLIVRFNGDDEATGSDLIQAKIPLKKDKSLANVTWDDFIQEGWGTAVDKGEAIAKAARIEIGFKGSAGTTNDFSIYAIGKYGTCDW